MSDDDKAVDEENVDGEEGEEESPKKSKKKLIIILAIVVLAGVGAGLFFTGIIGGSAKKSDLTEEEIAAAAPKVTYYDLDEFLVNLNNPGKQVNFLKMTVTLELPNLATQSNIENNLPRIRDMFNVYLRELRSSDLQGSAALHQLREELLLRINNIIGDESNNVHDILFKSIIAQ